VYYLPEISTRWGDKGVSQSNSVPYASSPNLGSQFASSDNLSATVADIAESMSEVIRTSLNSTSETVTWLTFPIIFTVLGLGFVAWVVVEAGKSDKARFLISAQFLRCQR
jgi:hypothetical protein